MRFNYMRIAMHPLHRPAQNKAIDSQPLPPNKLGVKALSQQGFTLVELMIVVAVIGILAKVAIPAYTNHVKSGKAAEATSTLADLRVKMEQYYQDNRTYVGGPYSNGPCTNAMTIKYFTYDCSVTPTLTAYTFRATGISAQGMSNFSFTVDQDNAKTSTFDGTTGSTCWLTKKDATC